MSAMVAFMSLQASVNPIGERREHAQNVERLSSLDTTMLPTTRITQLYIRHPAMVRPKLG